MPNDTVPDVREMIKRALYKIDPLTLPGTDSYGMPLWIPVPYEEINGLTEHRLNQTANAVLTALAGLADAQFVAAVERYGKWRAIARKEWDCQCVGCQSVKRFAEAKSAERTLLAIHAAATRPVIDDAAVERGARAIWALMSARLWKHAKKQERDGVLRWSRAALEAAFGGEVAES